MLLDVTAGNRTRKCYEGAFFRGRRGFMNTTWTLRRGSREHGPFTTDQVRAMARDGRLKASDLLRKNGIGEFCPVATFSAEILSKASPGPPVSPPELPSGLTITRSAPKAPPPPLSNRPPALLAPRLSPTRPTDHPLPAAEPAPAAVGVGSGDGRCSTSNALLLWWLIFGTVAAMAASILLSPWCTWDESGLKYPFAVALELIFDLLAVVFETIALYICWAYLPERYRFKGMAPWMAVILLFLPVVGFAGYCVAYGLLASGWQQYESETVVDDSQQKTGVVFWGWACAVTLALMWMLGYFTLLAEFLNSPAMEWYDSVVAPNERAPRVRGGRGAGNLIALVIRFFSLRDIARMWLAFATLTFFSGVHGLISPPVKADSPATAD